MAAVVKVAERLDASCGRMPMRVPLMPGMDVKPLLSELRERVAELLGVKPGEVGIKAKTPEGLNQDHVAMAHVTVLLESVALGEPVGRMVATADVEDEIDVVVKGLVGDSRDVSALGRKLPSFDTDDLT